MKVGEKYVIEIEEVMGKLARVKGFNSLVFDQNGLDKLIPLEKEISRMTQDSGNYADGYADGYVAGRQTRSAVHSNTAHNCSDCRYKLSTGRSCMYAADCLSSYHSDDAPSKWDCIIKPGDICCLKYDSSEVFTVTHIHEYADGRVVFDGIKSDGSTKERCDIASVTKMTSAPTALAVLDVLKKIEGEALRTELNQLTK